MLETILSRENMLQAYRAVARNGGSGGVDGVEMADFKAHLQAVWSSVKEALLSGCYKPSPVKRVSIPKPGGGKRHLGIPTLLDRMIQQAIHQVPGRSGYRVRIAAKSYKRLGASIRELTARSWSISTEQRITRLNQFIQGWVGYFSIADAKGQLGALDAWTRRRIRMSIWKRVRTDS